MAEKEELHVIFSPKHKWCDSTESVLFEIKKRLNSCGEKKVIQQIFPQNNKCLSLHIKTPSRVLSLEIPS